MGKLNHNNHLDGQRTSRSLLAITLAASLAAFGCTTNQNLGNGTPTRSGPEVRTAPTSGVTSGGERNTPPSNPSMTSSYSSPEALPRVTPRSSGVIRRSADEAAAIMAGRQALRGRYLGVVSPGASGRGYESAGIQTYVNPAFQTNPQLTVNSSISSPPTPGISSGAEGLFDAGGGAVIGGTTAAATITGGDVTPTAAATTLTPGTFAGSVTLPTVASSGVPTVTAASVGAGRTLTTAGRTTATAATTGTTTGATAAAPTNGTFAAGALVGSGSGAVRILRGASGGVTVTNVGTTPTTATTTTSRGRNQ